MTSVASEEGRKEARSQGAWWQQKSSMKGSRENVVSFEDLTDGCGAGRKGEKTVNGQQEDIRKLSG